MKKLRYLSLLLVVMLLVTGCGKGNPKKDLENALLKMKDTNAISMNLELSMGTAEMKIPMKMEFAVAKDFMHMKYSVTMLGQSEEQELYMMKKGDKLNQYQFDNENNRWVYTTVENDVMDNAEKVTGEEFDKNIDEFMKYLSSVKKVKSDKDGYDKLEITVSKKSMIDAAKKELESDEEKEEVEKSFESAPEEIKFYAYLKDGELASMTIDASTIMGEGALMGMSIYDVTIELVGRNDKVDTAYPKNLDEATYLTPEEFAQLLNGSANMEM